MNLREEREGEREEYTDLSLSTATPFQLRFLIAKLQSLHYSQAAIDFQCDEQLLKSPPPLFEDLQVHHPKQKEFPSIKLLSRVTLITSSPTSIPSLAGTHSSWDVVAVRPKNEKMFHALCTEVDVDISNQNYDLLSLTAGEKCSFSLKRGLVREAVRRGKHFQIQYSKVFQEDTRVITLTNISSLIKACRSSNLVVGSHAANHHQIRTPYDVAALLVSLGLQRPKALFTLRPQILLATAAHRLFSRGAVQEIPQKIARKLTRCMKKHRQRLLFAIQSSQQQPLEEYQKQ